MTLYQGPILLLAATHEQQQRLAAAEQLGLARRGTNQPERDRAETSNGLTGRIITAVGWLANFTLIDRIAQP